MAPPCAALVANPAPPLTPNNFPRDKGVKYLLDSTPGGLRSIPAAYVVPSSHQAPAPVGFSFPIIDVGGLSDPALRSSVVRDVARASKEAGFFLVVNHGISPSLMKDVVDAVTAFFALPAEEKMKVNTPEEKVLKIYYGSNVTPSQPQPTQYYWRDCMRHWGHPHIDEVRGLLPAVPEKYAAASTEYLEKVWGLAMRIAGAISEGVLDREAGYVQSTLGEGFQAMLNSCYPRCPQPELALGVAPHKDHGAVTVLMDNGVPGVQLEAARGGGWVDVPRVEGALLVILGEQMERATEGKAKAPKHRVVVNDKVDRISIAVGNCASAVDDEARSCAALIS